MTQAEQLDHLIADQARDLAAPDRIDRRHRSRHEFNATDGKVNIDRFSTNPPRDGWVFLGSSRPWSEAETARAKAATGECPCCADVRAVGLIYCCCCDAASLDGRVSWPGLPVGSAIDHNFPVDGPSYRPDLGRAQTRRQRRRAAAQARRVVKARDDLGDTLARPQAAAWGQPARKAV